MGTVKKTLSAVGLGSTNGALRDMVSRSFMRELRRAGHIILPPKRSSPINYLANRKKSVLINIDQTPVSAKLSEIQTYR